MVAFANAAVTASAPSWRATTVHGPRVIGSDVQNTVEPQPGEPESDDLSG